MEQPNQEKGKNASVSCSGRVAYYQSPYSRPPDQERILPLSAEAISQIRSSKHITSLQGVILSLLENSLDAGAAKVSITVDWRRGACSLHDDGSGIPAFEFAETGGLGRMYCTSKHAPAGTTIVSTEQHGSTGTFLAELAAMSLLSITSVDHAREQSATLTLHQGKVVARRVNDLHVASEGDFVQPSGTNVTVRDLFGNMPVRVKHRAQIVDNGTDHDRAWHELNQGIIALLLTWPKPCAIKLKDANKTGRTLNILGQHSSTSTALTSRSLGHLAGKSRTLDLRDKLPILFQSGLVPPHSRSKWVPLLATTSVASLKGLVCLDPAPSRHCQFIAIGPRPCDTQSGLHEAVNKIFTNSNFGAAEENATNSTSDGTAGKTRGHPASTRQMQPRRGIDRFPMYYIRLQLGERSSENTQLDRMSDSGLKALTDVLEAAVSAWLERTHFRPRKKRKRKSKDLNQSPSQSISPSTLIADDTTAGRLDATTQPKSSAPSFDRGHHVQTNKRRTVVDLTKGSSSTRRDRLPHRPGNHILDLEGLSRIRRGQATTEIGVYEMNPGLETREGQPANHFTSHGCTKHPLSITHETALEPSISHEKHGEYTPTSEDFGSIDYADMIAAEESTTDDLQLLEDKDPLLDWVHPVSQQTYRVNARTGGVLPLRLPRDAAGARYEANRQPRRRAGIDTTLSSTGRSISLARRSRLAVNRIASPERSEDRLSTALQTWKNPVFSRQEEEPIPVASTHGPGLMEAEEPSNYCRSKSAQRSLSLDVFPDVGIKLSRTALRHALAIRQVDKKFVLCKIPSTGDSPTGSDQSLRHTLLLVDQHAASERIILESLLNALCEQANNTEQFSIRTASLANETTRAKSIVFDISEREHELFEQYRQHFSVWGILYELVTGAVPYTDMASSCKPDHRIIVRSLPAVVAERCANYPALCIEMLRTELWDMAGGNKRPTSSLCPVAGERDNHYSHSWLSILPLLPDGLRNMLHSRSCRSAIMFNDELNLSQCQELLADLGDCLFPFICAHGRTSMVPLTELDSDSHEEWNNIDDNTAAFEFGLTVDREEICMSNSLLEWMKEK